MTIKRFSTRKSEDLPKAFYNLKADLSVLPKPPLNPGTGQPLQPQDLEPVFPKGFIQHAGTMERFVNIPDAVLEKFAMYRPTPLIYASFLKKSLDTPAHVLQIRRRRPDGQSQE